MFFLLFIFVSLPQHNFNDRGFLCFETITLVPIQTKLLDASLLTSEEVRKFSLISKLL